MFCPSDKITVPPTTWPLFGHSLPDNCDINRLRPNERAPSAKLTYAGCPKTIAPFPIFSADSDERSGARIAIYAMSTATEQPGRLVDASFSVAK